MSSISKSNICKRDVQLALKLAPYSLVENIEFLEEDVAPEKIRKIA